MGNNHKKTTRITRSLSLQADVVAAVDAMVAKRRLDNRSALINDLLEHVWGIAPHPEAFPGQAPAFKRDRAQRHAADPGVAEQYLLGHRVMTRHKRNGGTGIIMRRPANALSRKTAA